MSIRADMDQLVDDLRAVAAALERGSPPVQDCIAKLRSMSQELEDLVARVKRLGG